MLATVPMPMLCASAGVSASASSITLLFRGFEREAGRAGVAFLSCDWDHDENVNLVLGPAGGTMKFIHGGLQHHGHHQAAAATAASGFAPLAVYCYPEKDLKIHWDCAQ